MNEKVMIAGVALCAVSGCVVVPDGSVSAGDPLDAHFLLTWVTNDARTGTSVNCYSVGADTVRVRARNVSTGTVLVDLFKCDAATGETFSLTAGDYSVSVDLVACRGDASCRRPDVLSALSTRALFRVWRDDDIDLGHFVFLVD